MKHPEVIPRILAKARGLVDNGVWGQGDEVLYNPPTTCAGRAIDEAAIFGPLGLLAYEAVAADLPEPSPSLPWWAPSGATDIQKVIAFNDHPKTTKADVLALFDRAIESSSSAAGIEPPSAKMEPNLHLVH